MKTATMEIRLITVTDGNRPAYGGKLERQNTTCQQVALECSPVVGNRAYGSSWLTVTLVSVILIIAARSAQAAHVWVHVFDAHTRMSIPNIHVYFDESGPGQSGGKFTNSDGSTHEFAIADRTLLKGMDLVVADQSHPRFKFAKKHHREANSGYIKASWRIRGEDVMHVAVAISHRGTSCRCRFMAVSRWISKSEKAEKNKAIASLSREIMRTSCRRHRTVTGNITNKKTRSTIAPQIKVHHFTVGHLEKFDLRTRRIVQNVRDGSRFDAVYVTSGLHINDRAFRLCLYKAQDGRKSRRGLIWHYGAIFRYSRNVPKAPPADKNPWEAVVPYGDAWTLNTGGTTYSIKLVGVQNQGSKQRLTFAYQSFPCSLNDFLIGTWRFTGQNGNWVERSFLDISHMVSRTKRPPDRSVSYKIDGQRLKTYEKERMLFSYDIEILGERTVRFGYGSGVWHRTTRHRYGATRTHR
jgi:hypothetical protein